MAINNNHTPTHNYTCEVWQSEAQNSITTTYHRDDYDTISTPQRSELFLIDLFVTYDVVLDDNNADTETHYSQFMAQKHLLLDNAMSWSMISTMLSRVLVPLHAQPFLIHKISASARAIAARPANAASETIRLAVSLVERATGSGPARVHDFCVICLEGCEDGGARLPCSHCYHEECILSWFEKSNLCPLCRFRMPLDY